MIPNLTRIIFLSYKKVCIGVGSYFKVGGRDFKSKYIKCKRRDGDVQSTGGRTSPLSSGGGGGGGGLSP